MIRRFAVIAMALFSVMTSSAAFAQTDNGSEQRFPSVTGVDVTPVGNGRFDFVVTISSPYDSAARHANGFRIMTGEGIVYAETEFAFNPANGETHKQALRGVAIPADVRTVTIQARDLENGYGGRTAPAFLPR